MMTLLAQSPTPSPGAEPASSGASGLLILALMIGAFYFIGIRPQRQRLKAHQALVSSIGVGDEVETVAGIFGRIVAGDDETFQVELAPGTTVRMARGAIRRKVVPEEPPSEQD